MHNINRIALPLGIVFFLTISSTIICKSNELLADINRQSNSISAIEASGNVMAPKKNFRAKRKIAGLWDCHSFLFYKSNLQKQREKQIKKQRGKR
jgi:hypothetical protein